MRALSEALSKSEADELEACEEVVRAGLAEFVAVGDALRRIRDSKLYRTTHATFDDYLQDRWDILRQTGYRLMQAADTMANLSPIGDKLPTNEAQVRELSAAPAEMRQDAWKDAVLGAPKGKVTAAVVKASVRKVTVAAQNEAEVSAAAPQAAGADAVSKFMGDDDGPGVLDPVPAWMEPPSVTLPAPKARPVEVVVEASAPAECKRCGGWEKMLRELLELAFGTEAREFQPASDSLEDWQEALWVMGEQLRDWRAHGVFVSGDNRAKLLMLVERHNRMRADEQVSANEFFLSLLLIRFQQSGLADPEKGKA